MTTALQPLPSMTSTSGPLAWAQGDVRAAQIDAQLKPKAVVQLHDNKGYPLMELGDYISAKAGGKIRSVGTGEIQLKGSDPAGPLAMKCKSTVVPITVRKEGLWKWTGRIDTCEKTKTQGVKTYNLQLVHDTNWLNKWLCRPTWFMPLELQPIREAVYIGPIITCIKTMLGEQQYRTHLGLNELIDNLTEPSGWFATYIEKIHEGGDGSPPYVVIPTDPLHDTSKWTCITGRNDTMWSLIQQPMKDCGVVPKVWMWEPGEPQPAPNSFTLTEPTICFDFVDKTNVTGITGTALDGLIGEGVQLVDAALGGILGALLGVDMMGVNDTDATNPYAGILSTLFGLNSKPPWAIFEDGPQSGIVESHIVAHHPQAYTVVGGGKSPEWVNKGIDLILEAVIGAIIAAIAAFTAGAGAALGAIPNTLLDGVFDDMVLAFQQSEDVGRRIALGRFGYPEYPTTTGGTAYTFDELVAIESALWDSRGFYTVQIKVRDGHQYVFGLDFTEGDALSYVDLDDMVIYTDYLSEWMWSDDRTNADDLELTVGDGTAIESPFAKFARQYASLLTAVKAITMTPA